MKKIYFALLMLGFWLYSCNPATEQKNPNSENPFFSEYNTPFNVPPFDKIRAEHFIPAFKEGMKRKEADFKQIIENQETPTFENTILAYDNCGKFLNDARIVFSNLTGSNTNDTLQKIQKEFAPILSKHGDSLMMLPGLFQKIKAVYDSKDNANLNTEQLRLTEKIYKRFVRNGAGLDSVKQKQLQEINQKLTIQSVKFSDNLLKETKGFQLIIDKKEDLAGLPQSVIDAAMEDAKKEKMEGKWLFTLDNPSVMPFLTYADNRSLREKILKAYTSRGNNNNEYDNKEVIAQIFNLRLEKAKLLGYKSFADFVLEERMAKTPEKVNEFLMKLWDPALKVAKKEAVELQAYIKKTGNKFKLEPWDWRYYAEKVRKEKYDLDEEQIRQYFPLESVKLGAFMVANKLYGITFTPLNNVPTYHPDASVYEVKDKDSSHLAILYMDFFPRGGKRGGAWCTGFRSQYTMNGKDIRPVVSMVMNFSKPTGDAPALLSFDETNTLFHEFGHALHSILSKVTYRGSRDVFRDYVELPSQIMENWASDPEVMPLYAKHFKTGEVIPKELIDKMMKSRFYGNGFATVEYLAASLLDMDYHSITEPAPGLDVLRFEENAMNKIGLIPEILPRYRTTYFGHISGDGYAAGYYVYSWAEVLDADAYEAFKQKGLFDQNTALLFRQNVLEKGSSEDEMTAYKRFRGAEPDIQALIKRKGFDQVK